MSVFHGVRDPIEELDSPRYFRWAERLKFYGGAVAAALDAHPTLRKVSAPSFVSSAEALQMVDGVGPGEGAVLVDDVAVIAAMSQHPGFPGIGYSGG